MTVETPHNVVQHWYSMPTQGLLDILPGKPFFVYIAKFNGQIDELAEGHEVTYASNYPTCIIRSRDHGLQTFTDHCLIPTQWEKFNTDSTTNLFYSRRQLRRRSRASPERSETIWQKFKYLLAQRRYTSRRNLAFSPRFINILQKFESMWDRHPRLNKAVQHAVKLETTDKRPIRSALFHAGPLVRKCEKQKINRMLASHVIKPMQTECASPIFFVPMKHWTLRFCVYYSALNVVTIWHSWMISCKDESIDSLGDARYFRHWTVTAEICRSKLPRNIEVKPVLHPMM